MAAMCSTNTNTPHWLSPPRTPSTSKSKHSTLPNPPGFTSQSTISKSTKGKTDRKPPTNTEMDTLKLKKAWELAIAPAKQLPMNAIGMYMSGNSLQTFSIMMVFMLFKGPITAILGISDVFTRFETDGTRQRLIGVKIVYIAMNLLAVGLGIWKVNGMGLLPTTRSDWLAWESTADPLLVAVPARDLGRLRI